MDIGGLPKKPQAKTDYGFAWRRAEQLGIDAAGLTGPLVAKEVARVEEAMAKKAEAEKKAKEDAQKDAQGGEGQEAGQVVPPVAPVKPAAVALIDLKVDHLKRIAEFLVVPLADARRKDMIAESISKSDAWQKADQQKIVEATAAG